MAYGHSIPKILYHAGDRRNNLDDVGYLPHFKEIKNQAKSVACLIPCKHIQKQADGSFRLIYLQSYGQWIQKQFNVPFGEQERFRDEPNPGLGTAFLVGTRYALTAAHCVCKNESNELDDRVIRKVLLVFYFHMKGQASRVLFKASQVYQINRVVAHTWDPTANGADWALLELDRNVQGRVPLSLNFTDRVVRQTDLYMLGHPSGLPIKYTDEADVTADHDQHRFETQIDAFAGNSGSPVFNCTNLQVVGILVQGLDDFEVNPHYKGSHTARVQARHATAAELAAQKAESCQRISNLTFVKDLLPYIDVVLPADHPLNRGTIQSGLNLCGQCPNCNSGGGVTIFSKGFSDVFNMNKICSQATCGSCGDKLKGATIMFLTDCVYQILEGSPKPGVQFTLEPFTVSQGQTFALNLDSWDYLEIAVRKK